MLTVHSITKDAGISFGNINAAFMACEDVIIRVGKTGYSLSYIRKSEYVWQQDVQICYEQPSAYLKHSDCTVYAAFEDEQPVGCAVIRPSLYGWCDLIDIRVDVGSRRKGIATALLAVCERHARINGLPGIRVMANDYNAGFCQFLQRKGFALKGIDPSLLSVLPAVADKPALQRPVALYFYRPIDNM